MPNFSDPAQEMAATLAVPRTYRTRISPVERAAKAASDAMRIAREALMEHAGLTEDQAKATLLAIRGGLVPGAKMEILPNG